MCFSGAGRDQTRALAGLDWGEKSLVAETHPDVKNKELKEAKHRTVDRLPFVPVIWFLSQRPSGFCKQIYFHFFILVQMSRVKLNHEKKVFALNWKHSSFFTGSSGSTGPGPEPLEVLQAVLAPVLDCCPVGRRENGQIITTVCWSSAGRPPHNTTRVFCRVHQIKSNQWRRRIINVMSVSCKRKRGLSVFDVCVRGQNARMWTLLVSS